MRRHIQYLFLAFNVYIGVRLYLFYSYFLGRGSAYVSRPPSTEAYLPIAALMSLKYWLVTGVFDQVHPAGLTILVAAFLTALLWRRGFCSWICPIGTISEIAHRAGQRLGVTVRPPRFVDIPLRSLKYVLMAVFLLAVIGMDAPSIRAFVNSPFNKLADIKMLLFFLHLSTFSMLVLANLIIWSFFIKNFWCRYLCPYGAALGILSKVGMVKIARDENNCIDCKKCEKICPAYIDITKVKTVTSLECIDCLDCIRVCPVENTLEVKTARLNKVVGPRAYGLILVGGFMFLILLAQITGHWNTNISLAEYRQMVPNAARYGHP
ncbi:MAG: 4Fe-4S binding protein [Actinomycetota bacterium]|nr:4Fe-4S binding protein [Actinomycetota bacterium]